MAVITVNSELRTDTLFVASSSHPIFDEPVSYFFRTSADGCPVALYMQGSRHAVGADRSHAGVIVGFGEHARCQGLTVQAASLLLDVISLYDVSELYTLLRALEHAPAGATAADVPRLYREFLQQLRPSSP